jgi:hypothetical protein
MSPRLLSTWLQNGALAAGAVGALAAWMLVAPRPAFPHETLTTTVLFDREIVRILDKHCVMCHYENGPSFPLETWEQTWLHARRIRSESIARHMPPWSAFPGYGHFINDNGLTLRETQFIVSWVEGSGPRNAGTVFTNTADPNAVRRKEVRAHSDIGHWELGEPQLKLPVGAEIATGLKAGRGLRAVEYMPGDRRVVAAAFFTVRETGQWIGAWTPWYSHFDLPKGSAWRLPAGAHIVADIRYREGKQPADAGTLGLFFADQPSLKPVSDLVLGASASRKVLASKHLTADIDALALRVESQPGVQSIEVSARKPNGTTEVMLFDKNIRADWPTPYIFKEPVLLPRGSDLAVVAYYPGTGGIRLTVTSQPAHSGQ